MDTLTAPLEKAFLGSYSSGLGVTSENEDGSSPGHTDDNMTDFDMVIFFMSHDNWDPISVVLVPFGSNPDTDMTWIVGGRLADFGTEANPFSGFEGKTLAQVKALENWYQHDSSGNGSQRTALLTPDNLTETGRYLIIAAKLNNTDRDDRFKIKEMTSTPEPGTWVLLTVGCTGLIWMRRRIKVQRS